jgi:hypothetical protein
VPQGRSQEKPHFRVSLFGTVKNSHVRVYFTSVFCERKEFVNYVLDSAPNFDMSNGIFVKFDTKIMIRKTNIWIFKFSSKTSIIYVMFGKYLDFSILAKTPPSLSSCLLLCYYYLYRNDLF